MPEVRPPDYPKTLTVHIVSDKKGNDWGHFTNQLAAQEFVEWLAINRKKFCDILSYDLQFSSYQAIVELKHEELLDPADKKRKKTP